MSWPPSVLAAPVFRQRPRSSRLRLQDEEPFSLSTERSLYALEVLPQQHRFRSALAEDLLSCCLLSRLRGSSGAGWLKKAYNWALERRASPT
jgi:hypothetical protein